MSTIKAGISNLERNVNVEMGKRCEKQCVFINFEVFFSVLSVVRKREKK